MRCNMLVDISVTIKLFLLLMQVNSIILATASSPPCCRFNRLVEVALSS